MKAVIVCAAILFLGFAGESRAVSLEVDGTELTVAELMERCKNAEGGSEAQLRCFDMLAQLLQQQDERKVEAAPSDSASVIDQALSDLRAAAEYRDEETGLSIVGSGCEIEVFYYGNFYRNSRRNVTSIDLFSANFDASKLQIDQMQQVQGQSMIWFRGTMGEGATAVSLGGEAMESATHGFEAKSASASVDEYARAVAAKLPPKVGQTFDFVLIHPKRGQSGNDIWKAFGVYVGACRG